MLVHTPRLCGEPLFLEGHDKSHEPAATIECQPVVRRLQEQLSQEPATELDAPAPVPDPPLAHAATDSPRLPTTQETPAAAHEGAPVGDADSSSQSDIQAALDDLLDHEGTLTLVYDAESGEIESVITELGEDVFVDSELKKQLFGEVVQAALDEREERSVEEEEEEKERNAAEATALEREKTTAQSLEDLAKLVSHAPRSLDHG